MAPHSHSFKTTLFNPTGTSSSSIYGVYGSSETTGHIYPMENMHQQTLFVSLWDPLCIICWVGCQRFQNKRQFLGINLYIKFQSSQMEFGPPPLRCSDDIVLEIRCCTTFSAWLECKEGEISLWSVRGPKEAWTDDKNRRIWRSAFHQTPTWIENLS